MFLNNKLIGFTDSKDILKDIKGRKWNIQIEQCDKLPCDTNKEFYWTDIGNKRHAITFDESEELLVYKQIKLQTISYKIIQLIENIEYLKIGNLYDIEGVLRDTEWNISDSYDGMIAFDNDVPCFTNIWEDFLTYLSNELYSRR